MPVAEKMTAVLVTIDGGFDKLEYRHDVLVPDPGEILVSPVS